MKYWISPSGEFRSFGEYSGTHDSDIRNNSSFYRSVGVKSLRKLDKLYDGGYMNAYLVFYSSLVDQMLRDGWIRITDDMARGPNGRLYAEVNDLTEPIKSNFHDWANSVDEKDGRRIDIVKRSTDRVLWHGTVGELRKFQFDESFRKLVEGIIILDPSPYTPSIKSQLVEWSDKLLEISKLNPSSIDFSYKSHIHGENLSRLCSPILSSLSTENVHPNPWRPLWIRVEQDLDPTSTVEALFSPVQENKESSLFRWSIEIIYSEQWLKTNPDPKFAANELLSVLYHEFVHAKQFALAKTANMFYRKTVPQALKTWDKKYLSHPMEIGAWAHSIVNRFYSAGLSPSDVVRALQAGVEGFQRSAAKDNPYLKFFFNSGITSTPQGKRVLRKALEISQHPTTIATQS